LALRAAGRWYSREDRAVDALAEGDGAFTVPVKARRKAWARLLAKVYEIDVLCCPRCGARMMVIAVVRDPESIRTIIACINSKGRGPP
jgi:hypothetical protein